MKKIFNDFTLFVIFSVLWGVVIFYLTNQIWLAVILSLLILATDTSTFLPLIVTIIIFKINVKIASMKGIEIPGGLTSNQIIGLVFLTYIAGWVLYWFALTLSRRKVNKKSD